MIFDLSIKYNKKIKKFYIGSTIDPKVATVLESNMLLDGVLPSTTQVISGKNTVNLSLNFVITDTNKVVLEEIVKKLKDNKIDDVIDELKKKIYM